MVFIFAFHALIVLTFTVRILWRDDLSPPARLAWFVVIILLPYFGSLVYFLFGEVDLGNRANKRHREVFDEIKNKAAGFMGTASNIDDLISPQFQTAFRYAGSINGFHAVAGNEAALMADGAETRDRMIADIDAAQDHVHVLYYIWLNDNMGTEIAKALIRAAKRGVTCRAMADGMGSRKFVQSELWQKMRNAGVQLAVALPIGNPLVTILSSRLDLRNHRKITVIDGHITYCGSRNSADPEFLVKAKYAPWVDIMLRIEGPVVAQNQLLFASDWLQATNDKLEQFKLCSEPRATGFPAQVMGDGPTERIGATPQLFSSLIASARESVTLSTPYFVPDATVLEALCASAYSGVKVRLVVPKVNDSWVVAAASRSFYRRLLEAGCSIYEFENGLLHAKTLTIDGAVSLIGSSNLDLRSFDLNYENNVVLQDAKITQEIFDRQNTYISNATEVTLNTVLGWPWYRRIWNNVIATVGPIL